MLVRGTYSLAREDKQAQQDTDGADDRCRKSYNANKKESRKRSLDQGVAGFDADTEWSEKAVHDRQLVNNSRNVTAIDANKVKVAIPSC